MPEFSPAVLHQFTRAVCAGLGSREEEQHLVADQLINANLTGHDSHGIGMLPQYTNNALAGRLIINVSPEVVTDRGPILVFDGLSGFGQVNGFVAMTKGIAKAQEHGLALVGLRNSFHIGRIGHWGEQCAAAGMTSIHFVNVAAHHPLVAPYGGYEARFGTNPVCIAIPGRGERPAALLDMATSKIALGKARVAMNKGVPVPDDSVLDADGALTNDPNVMFDETNRGALVAFGDYKGSGLALMCELLGAALIGGHTIEPSQPRTGALVNSMLTIIIDPSAVGDRASLIEESQRFLDYYKNSAVRAGASEVLLPGDPEVRSRRERAASIPVDDATTAELKGAADAAGASSAVVLLD